MARLTVLLPNGSRTVLRLEAGKRRLVGSDPRCSVRLPVPSVEPFHCEIFHAAGLWQMRDLQSAGGTRVNGAPIESEALAGGDTIEVGEAMLVFESEEAPRVAASGTGAARSRAPRARPSRAGAVRPGHPGPPRAAALRRSRSLAPFIALVVVVAAGIVGAIAISSGRAGRAVPEDPDVGAGGLASAGDLPPERGGGARDVEVAPDARSAGPALAEPSPEPGRAEALPPASEWDPVATAPMAEMVEEVPPAEAPVAGAPIAGAPAATDGGAPRPVARTQGTADRSLAELRDAVLVDLAALDAEAAEARIAKARETGADADGLASLETECREVRAARDALLDALEDSAREQTMLDVPAGTTLVSAAPDPILRVDLGGTSRGATAGGATIRVRSLAVDRERRTVALGTARGARLGTLRVTSLGDGLLLRLLEGVPPGARGAPRNGGAGNGGAGNGASGNGLPADGAADVRLRLSRLLFHAEGPSRARALLEPALQEPDRSDARTVVLTGASVPEQRGDGGSASGSHAGLWVARKARSIARERARLEAGGGPQGSPRAGGDPGPGIVRTAAWALLASEALCALVSPDASLASDEVLDRLRDDFLAARRESLPLAALFHAAEVSTLADGRVRISYDFARERNPADQTTDQTADFRPIGLSTEKPRILKKSLILQGEYRLLSGEPFVGRLSVRGKATPLVPEAPNVNVALWTHATDAVTCHDGAATTWFTLLRQQVGAPSDYFVFGMGYRAVAWMLLDRPAEQVLLASTRESVDLPALVLLAGSRGSPLHKDLGECLLAEKVSPGGLRKVDFLLDWDGVAGDGVAGDGVAGDGAAGDGAAVTWTVNGHPVPLEGELTRSRLDATARRRGSVTILTNGRPVGVAVVEVVGELDPAWVGAERTARALRDLEREAPAPAGPVPAGASTQPGDRADGQPVADASLPVPGRRLGAGDRGLHARGPTNENGPRKS